MGRAKNEKGARGHGRFLMEMLEKRELLAATPTTATIGAAVGFGGTTTAGDVITGMVSDAQGVTYVAGYFSLSMDVDPSGGTFMLTGQGQRDMFIAAFDGSATLLWAKSMGGAGDDAPGKILLNGGDLYVTGSFSGTIDADPGAGVVTLTSAGGTDGFLARFTTAGHLVWAKQFGGDGDDAASKIAVDGSGNLIVAGMFSNTADLDPGAGVMQRTATSRAADLFISKVDTNGDLAWVNDYTYDDDLVIANVAVDSANDHVYFAGDFRGNMDIDGSAAVDALSSTAYLGFVVQMDATGAMVWEKTFGQSGGPFSAPLIMDFTMGPNGNLVIGGDFGGTIDVDPSPAVHTISETISPDGFTGFVLTLDSSGGYLWSGALTGDSWSDVLAVTTDSGGNVYLAGEFNHISDFDFTAGVYEQTAPTNFNTAYAAKYDAAGHFIWEEHAFDAGGLSTAFALSVKANGTVVFAGYFATGVQWSTVGVPTALAGDTDDNFMVYVTQTQDTPAVEIKVTDAHAVIGQTFTLQAIVHAAFGVPTGGVTFRDGATVVGTAALDASGKASQVFVIAAGVHSYAVTYDGDVNFVAGSDTAPDVTVDANQLPIGNLESSAHGVLSGWAADLDDPTKPVVVQVWVDGVMRFAVKAKNDRPDLLQSVGGTQHGFVWRLPLLAAGTHAVSLVVYDSGLHTGVTFATATVTSDNAFFDEAWYLAAYPDVASAVTGGQVASAWTHFHLAGAHEGRSPSALFDEMGYRLKNPDVAAAIAAGNLDSGFAHFMAAGAAEGRDPSAYFDTAYYRRANPDVDAAIIGGSLTSAFQHFVSTGMIEGRRAVAWFDAAEYRAANVSVDTAIKNGLVRSAIEQFVSVGLAGGRAPSAAFDETFYLAQNPDVAAAVSSHAVASGLAHFVMAGFAEGRRSDPLFDAAYYLAQHPNVATLINSGGVKSAFQHYLLYGRLEGFAGHA